MLENAELLHLDRQLCFKLYTASRLVIRAYQPMLKALNITYPQYLVLMLLWEWSDAGLGGSSVNKLGKRLQLDSGTLTPLLKRLEAAGMISRQRSESDERQLEVSLTAEGVELRSQALEWMAGFQKSGVVDAAELDILHENLDLLLDKIY